MRKEEKILQKKVKEKKWNLMIKRRQKWNKNPIVFLLWGKPAQKKEEFILNPSHYVIKSPHPSPLSAYNGFFGSKPYSKANLFLKQNGFNEIDWKID